MGIQAGWLHRLVAGLPDVTFRYRFKPTPGFDYVSPSVESLTGYTTDDFYAYPHLLEVLVGHLEVPYASLTAPLRDVPISRLRESLRRKDGSIVLADRWYVTIRDEKGDLEAVEGLVHEITNPDPSSNGHSARPADPNADRKQFADFVQMVAHDVHQSIVTANVYAGILKKALDRGDIDRAISSTAVIETAIQELDRMIRDFVDGILTEGSEIRLECQRLDLTEYVSATVADLATTQRINWIQVEGEESVIVEADPRHLGRILDNLLTNALKYSEPGSPIVLRVEPQANHALVSVSDRGIGIAPADLPRLFQRGFRTRDSLRQSSGLGLGLYISRLLVEAHGGRIGAESTLGQGSTFYVELPLASIPSATGR